MSQKNDKVAPPPSVQPEGEKNLTQQSVSPTLISQKQGSKESEKGRSTQDDGRTKLAGGANDFHNEKGIGAGKPKGRKEGEEGDLISAGYNQAGDGSVESQTGLKQAEEKNEGADRKKLGSKL